MSDEITHMVFGGGGFCGLVYLGVLRFLEVEKLERKIRNVSGTSIGAFFATIFALRIPIQTIEERLIQLLSDESQIMKFPYPDILSVMNQLGMEDGHRFLRILKPELEKLTFLDLVKRTGVNLVICATHVDSMSGTYFSFDSTPNVLVYDALHASMAVPWIMKPVTIGQDHYIDGGVTDNIPYKPFEDVNASSILICYINMLPSMSNVMSSAWMYTYSVIQKFITPTNFFDILKKQFPNFIVFKHPPVPFIPICFEDHSIVIRTSQKEIEDAIIYGYEVMHSKFSHSLQSSRFSEGE